MALLRRGTGALFLPVLFVVTACDYLLTEPPADGDVLDGPVPGLTREELVVFVRGDGEFERRFTPADGLGPIFNNVACASCHSGDGRGRPENALIRVSRGSDPIVELGGPQIQTRSIPGAVAETTPAGVDVSIRLPPPVFGVGLIEAIPASAILGHADPFDDDGDGVSGRPNWVRPPSFVPAGEPGGGSGQQLGRFSRKAQVSTLLQQVVEAYHQDMGVTTEFLPFENTNPQVGSATLASDFVPDPEIDGSTVQAVIDYIRMLAAPVPGADNPETLLGAQLFTTVGCAACHVPSFRTGSHRIGALADQDVTLYSDLLLHDMGTELADNRPDGDANGREWRTAPLWGLRVVRDFLNGDMFLLHDGRATTVEQAILLHGGEADGARQRYNALSPDGRAALLEFVRTR